MALWIVWWNLVREPVSYTHLTLPTIEIQQFGCLVDHLRRFIAEHDFDTHIAHRNMPVRRYDN